MEVVFYIVGFLFILLLFFGVPLAVIQYRNASKELKKLKTMLK